MHRLVLGSAAYRQSSGPNPAAFKVDPDNRLLWRFSLKRLDAESIRDAMLAASGQLDGRFGGPYVPTTRDGSGEVRVKPDEPGRLRRSLYLQQRRSQTLSMLGVFDSPSIVFNCIQRPVSTMPLQSLSLLNSEFAVDAAAAFASRIEREAGSEPAARVEQAWLVAFARAERSPETIGPGVCRTAAFAIWRSERCRQPGLGRFVPDAVGLQRLPVHRMRQPMRPESTDRARQLVDVSRRAFLGTYAGSLGTLALAHMLAGSSPAMADEQPAASGAGAAIRPRAKNVICLFQHGGPSQMDLFDPKPALNKYHGQKYPGGELETHFVKQAGNVLGSPFKFNKHGQSGIELCEHLPHMAGIVDDITLIRSMNTESVDHETALRLIHSGRFLGGLPTWGAWVTYALGSENRNLPSYVVLSDPGGLPVAGEDNWSAGYLPAVYQGTPFRSGRSPVFNLETPEGLSPAGRRNELDFLAELNRQHLQRHPENSELAARLENFETAARMQTAMPGVVDLSDETAETRALYGLDDPKTQEYGTRCLLARRLVEKGVRFVQIFLSGQPWDTHTKNAENLEKLCARSDRPSAALVTDLKRRGLLDSTIVMWTGEFGRLPVSQGADGRDHNRRGFSLWLAGGGFKSGYVHGATDDFAYEAVKDVVNVHDLHATLLATLGLDHRKLTYPHDGRQASLTDADVTKAKLVPELLG